MVGFPKSGRNCEVVFCKFKGLFVTHLVFKVVEPDKSYILQTDASEHGHGLWLVNL